MQNVINSDYTLNGLEFTINNKLFKVSGSQSNNRIHDTIDTIKNIEKNSFKTYTREQLKKMLETYKAVLVIKEEKPVISRRKRR